MEFNAVKMKIEGIHIGDEGKLDAASPVIHSDTIFSAICNVWARAYGKEDLERMLDKFQNETPFIVSSAFPYSGEIFYFPKPFMMANIEIPEDKRKEFKKITSLPKQLFEKYVGASLKEEELITAINDAKSDFSKDHYMLKVAIDRKSSSTELFSFSENRFMSDSGYFFFYQCSDEYLEKFKNIVQILSDEGIGGKKTWGCGQFKCEFKTIDLNLPQSNCYCILSLYYPDKDEKLNHNCSYNLLERGGWIVSQTTTKTKRNIVYMLAEGSVFDYKPNGKLVDVSPEGFPHKVYRNGMAFAIPVVRKC